MKKSLILVVLISMMGYSQSSFDLFAHRGAMGYEVENSMASFVKALELGADRVELDVYRIVTGELVVFHDDNLKRLTGVDQEIETLSIEELQELKLSNGERIPLLSDVMKLLREKVILNIELKGKGTAQPVLALIDDMDYPIDQLIISSFRWDELETTRLLNNKIPIGILTELNPLDALDVASRLNAIAINPYYKRVDKITVDQLHEKGFKVYCWTVNELEEMAYLKSISVDGIFTNYLDLAKSLNL